MRDALERSAGSSVNALSGTGERLRSELSLVLDRLGDTSTTLERMVGSAGSDLDAIQTGLAERVGEFQRALGSISSQVAGLNRTSSTTQAKRAPSSIVSPNTPIRSPALRTICRQRRKPSTRRWIDGAKACRRLWAKSARKSEDFENLMRSFASTVEDFFNKAQARAKEINAALMMTTNGASATSAASSN